ncbi:MAG: hypothetical protein ACI9VM_000115 [Candidatus Azotimanducaceae bacterium]|jgi:hypothetical protein
MDLEVQSMLEEQGAKIDAIYASVEKTRRYFVIMMWASVIGFVIPAIALLFIIPSFIETYTTTLNEII